MTQLDIAVFNEWSAALSDDVVAGRVDAPQDSYEPDSGSRSGFLYERIRQDFRTVLDEWLATEPISNPDAPATPFEMEAYAIDGAIEAEALRTRADQLATEARTALSAFICATRWRALSKSRAFSMAMAACAANASARLACSAV